VSNQLHGLRKRLVAFGQLLQTLIDIHLANSISKPVSSQEFRYPAMAVWLKSFETRR
jgi:hypothetical protein